MIVLCTRLVREDVLGHKVARVVSVKATAYPAQVGLILQQLIEHLLRDCGLWAIIGLLFLFQAIFAPLVCFLLRLASLLVERSVVD